MSSSDDSPPLKKLLAAVREGDEKATEELYLGFYREFLGFTVYCLRASGCWFIAEHSEDINSAAWVRIWEHIEQLEDPEKFRPWVKTTIRRLAIDHVSGPGSCINERLNRVSFEDAELESVLSQIIPADEVALSAERLEAVLNAAESLDQELPYILIRRLEEVGFAEIARRLGESPANVRNTYYRGLKKLKILFGDKADPPDNGTEVRGGHSGTGEQQEEDDFENDIMDDSDDADDSVDAVM